ncbi:MAG TPA: hypothetical protein DCF84_07670 [Bacteroidetes bacterium]|nr:hypothetical protein [Bacteroidota bacterium]
MSNSVHFSLWSSRESTITQLANLSLVVLFTFSLYSYKLPELGVKSVLAITLIASQVYLLLESVNRLTMRQIGGSFFGALLFAVLPWTHAIVESGVDLAAEMFSLFFLLMVLTYQFTKSLDFLIVGIIMILTLFALSDSIGYHVIAFASFLLVMLGLIDRVNTANHCARYLGLFGILLCIGLGYSWYSNVMSMESLLWSLGGLGLLAVSFLGYLKARGFWLQRSLYFLVLLGAAVSVWGTFYFPLFLTLTVLSVLGLLPRFWMKYPFVVGFVYCCWETWPV